MAKNKISDYSATANSNTDVASINIDENCAPSGINNAIRAVMGHLKDFQSGTNADPFNGPVNGTLGATTPASAAVTTLTTSSTVTLSGGTANGVAYLNGSKVLTTGSALQFDGTNLGLGVTPSAWTVFKAFEVGGTGGNFIGGVNAVLHLGANTYYDGAYRYKTSATSSRMTLEDGGAKWFTATSGTAGNAISFTQAMTLDASGNLLVGTTGAQSALTVQGSTSGAWASFCINTNIGGVGSYTRGGGGSASLPLAVWAQYDGTERARIDSSGNLLVGVTADTMPNAGMALQPAQGNMKFRCGTANTFTQFYNQSNTKVGSIETNGTTTSYVTSSDYRLKENVQPMTGALSTVSALKPCTYTWKADGSSSQGFIAHELQAVIPECVVGEKDAVDVNGNPVYQGIDTSFLVATLTAAIQEQQAMISQLQADVAALKAA